MKRINWVAAPAAPCLGRRWIVVIARRRVSAGRSRRGWRLTCRVWRGMPPGAPRPLTRRSLAGRFAHVKANRPIQPEVRWICLALSQYRSVTELFTTFAAKHVVVRQLVR